MEEKRKFERFEISVPARIEITLPEGRKGKYDLKTCNLSAEGVCFEFEKPLPVGSQIKIELFLNFEELKTPADPRGTLIIATIGRVLRCDSGRAVLRFNEDYDFMTCLEFMQKEK